MAVIYHTDQAGRLVWAMMEKDSGATENLRRKVYKQYKDVTGIVF